MVMISPEQLAQATRQACTEAGFDLAGVAPIREDDIPEVAAFEEWVQAGHAGEMKYMEKRTEDGTLRRASASHPAPWLRAVVVSAINYNAATPYSTKGSDPLRRRISPTALGRHAYLAA